MPYPRTGYRLLVVSNSCSYLLVVVPRPLPPRASPPYLRLAPPFAALAVAALHPLAAGGGVALLYIMIVCMYGYGWEFTILHPRPLRPHGSRHRHATRKVISRLVDAYARPRSETDHFGSELHRPTP